MKKIASWIWGNLLFLLSLFLLAFIPLYPKIPLLDVKNTWVYVRIEDFIVLFVLFFWLVLLIKKKITLKTPLTLPIMAFWLVGVIATIHGVILIFPTDANVFPNVAFLTFIRHLEYFSLFFVAYAGFTNKKFLPAVSIVLTLTLITVIAYGFGQKYLGFPAYLTMNEEFAKGIPIRLSELSRVPSTFAGHYDLAAYLVLILPLLSSIILGVRNFFAKIALFLTVLLGFALLFMTVSRVSFLVLLLAIFVVFFFQKRRLLLYSIPFLVAGGFLFLNFNPSLLQRFSSTVKQIDVLVDPQTGAAIGEVRFVPRSYFDNKVIRVEDVENIDQVTSFMKGGIKEASPPAELTHEKIPDQAPLVVATNISTGENLPQGTGYINLTLSPVTRKLGNFFYSLPPDVVSTVSGDFIAFNGGFLVKRASAYDLSFTTRFQGEWPHAMAAFARNVFFGSGYGSVSLAVDNNYLRMLGETGLLGLGTFFAIFIILGIYIKKIFPDIDSPLAKSFIIGFGAGLLGLALNATLIDVFEASKIAFSLWLLVGITAGILVLYQKKQIDIQEELKRVVTSPYAVILYLLIATVIIYAPMLSNYFVADDFTWFRSAADCHMISGSIKCPGIFGIILNYFTDSHGLFFRPGFKIYFYLMYSFFWLNQTVYHTVSIFLQFLSVSIFYLLARKILKDGFLSALSSFLFLIMSGYGEAIFWVSSTHYLFSAVFTLCALMFFILWEERKKVTLLVLTLIFIISALLFDEAGVIIPFLLLSYKVAFDQHFNIRALASRTGYWILGATIPIYLVVRYASNSHWLSGDYSYNFTKLPFNLGGNIAGYLLVGVFGPITQPFYDILRNTLRSHLIIGAIITLIAAVALVLIYKVFVLKLDLKERKIVIFGSLFFLVSLTPFLGLGNISSRFSYLSTFGIVLVGVVLIKKLYSYLKVNGREIALGAVVIMVASFSLLQVIQVQQVHNDWHGAGDKVKQFFISIDQLYSDNWSSEPLELHFVNVPIKNGQAWIFPAGLKDALWFTFRNDNLRVFTHSNVEEALDEAGVSLAKRVFVFNDDGSLHEVSRFKNIPSGALRLLPLAPNPGSLYAPY